MDPHADATSIRWRPLVVCAAATIAAFAKAISYPFVNWGDPLQVLAPLSEAGDLLTRLSRLFLDWTAFPYQPVVQLTYILQSSIGGPGAAGFHGVNVALHTVAVILLYRLLRLLRADQIPAVIGALLFSLHPMRVEAVVWISGRAEVLAGLFVLAALLAFDRFRRSGSGAWYAASLAAALAAACSSVTTAPLPLLLYWYDRRILEGERRRSLATVVPFAIISAATLATAVAGRFANAAMDRAAWPWADELFFRPLTLLMFFGTKTAAPRHLVVLYPPLHFDVWDWLFAFAALAIVVQLWRWSRDRQDLRFGLAWVLASLIAALMAPLEDGSPVADRYTYVASLGLSILAAAVVQSSLARNEGRFARPLKIAAVVALAALGTLSSIHGETWSSSEALWRYTTDRAPASAVAHSYLGSALAQEAGDLVRAEESFTIALDRDASLRTAYVNRGVVRAAMGRTDGALLDLTEALRLDPADASTHMVRASIFRQLLRREDALRDVNLALALQPMNVAWSVERVELLLEMGRTGEAATELEVLRRAGYEVSVEKR